MPVGNQWKMRGGRSATVTEEPPAPAAKDPEPTGPQGKRLARLQKFRTKSQDAGKAAAEPSQPAKDGAAPATDGERPQVDRKKLGEKWSAASAKDDSKVVRKKRLEVTEAPLDGDSLTTADPANVGIIVENEPVRLEGVVRADDPSEFTKPLEVEKGFAKNLASRFLQQQQEDTLSTAERRRFKMDVASDEPEVTDRCQALTDSLVVLGAWPWPRGSSRTHKGLGLGLGLVN